MAIMGQANQTSHSRKKITSQFCRGQVIVNYRETKIFLLALISCKLSKIIFSFFFYLFGIKYRGGVLYIKSHCKTLIKVFLQSMTESIKITNFLLQIARFVEFRRLLMQIVFFLQVHKFSLMQKLVKKALYACK